MPNISSSSQTLLPTYQSILADFATLVEDKVRVRVRVRVKVRVRG